MGTRTSTTRSSNAVDTAQRKVNSSHAGRLQALVLLNNDFAEKPPASQQRQDAWLRATSRWLIDASLEGDDVALEEASTAMRRHYRLALQHKAERLAGAIHALNEVIAASAQRAEQRTAVAALEPGTYAAKMLLAITRHPGITNTLITAEIDGTESQTSRAGRELAERGLANYAKVGRAVRWTTTPRGRNAIDDIEKHAKATQPADLDRDDVPATDVAPAAKESTAGVHGTRAVNRYRSWYDEALSRLGTTGPDHVLPWLLIAPPENQSSPARTTAGRKAAAAKPRIGRYSDKTLHLTFDDLAVDVVPNMLVLAADSNAYNRAYAQHSSPEPVEAKIKVKRAKSANAPTGGSTAARAAAGGSPSANASTQPWTSTLLPTEPAIAQALYDSVLTMLAKLPSGPDAAAVDKMLINAIDDTESLTAETLPLTDEEQEELSTLLKRKLLLARAPAERH